MALVLGDNFSYGGAKPLDARLKYNTLAEMKAVADSTMYNGCTAYCEEADKTYQWKSTNTVDENTGKWREFTSGGSTGGGHTIEDSEGTALTQRDTLQFGEGFKAEDDSTNEKTVITPDVMQSGDMDDVVTPLPSVQSRYHRYSTEEQIVGTWYNGKTLYEKTYILDALSGIVDGTAKEFKQETGFSVNDVGEIFISKAHLKTTTGKSCYQLNDAWLMGNNVSYVRCSIETNTSVSPITEVMVIRCNRESMNTMIPVVTVCYTKP